MSKPEQYATRIYLQRFDDGLLVKLGEYRQWLKPARKLDAWLAAAIRSEKVRRSLNQTADDDCPPVESTPLTLDVSGWSLLDLARGLRYATQASICCQGPLSGKLLDEIAFGLAVLMEKRCDSFDTSTHK